MSESVWFEEVDTALIKHIQSIVKLPNSEGELTSVPVTVRKPDEDFKIESYPSITIYNLYSVRDEFRYYPDTVMVMSDPESHVMVEEKSAIPYSLHYQLDFWSTKQSDMNAMTRVWLGNHPDKSFNLDVIDASGKERSSFVLLLDNLKKNDFLNGVERTFNSNLTYKIWVEIDENIRKGGYLITEIPPPIIGG